jgi:hypothetical protein
MYKCLAYLSVKQYISGVTQPVFIHFISFEFIEYIRKYSEYKNYELKHAWTQKKR